MPYRRETLAEREARWSAPYSFRAAIRGTGCPLRRNRTIGRASSVIGAAPYIPQPSGGRSTKHNSSPHYAAPVRGRIHRRSREQSRCSYPGV